MSQRETPISTERKRQQRSKVRPQSSRVEGSRHSRLGGLNRTSELGVNGESKVISVRDLFDGQRNSQLA